jgi:hypothetical protein
LAAIALAQDRHYHPQVREWIAWYIRHLNHPDKWGLSCTVYDYNVNGTTVTSAYDADSTDSYAATFLTLAWTYWRTGDETAHGYLRTLKSELECIANVIFETQQDNGLTWAKPDYKTEYLMDSVEVYRGLKDAGDLFETAFHDNDRGSRYRLHAAKALHGIADSLWDPAHNSYRTYAGAPPADWKVWYPDSTAQLFPVLEGVLQPDDPKARLLYEAWLGNKPTSTCYCPFNAAGTLPYAHLNRCLLIRRLLIFDSSVVRGIPSFPAAPDGPEIRPRLSFRAASMISLS